MRIFIIFVFVVVVNSHFTSIVRFGSSFRALFPHSNSTNRTQFTCGNSTSIRALGIVGKVFQAVHCLWPYVSAVRKSNTLKRQLRPNWNVACRRARIRFASKSALFECFIGCKYRAPNRYRYSANVLRFSHFPCAALCIACVCRPQLAGMVLCI